MKLCRTCKTGAVTTKHGKLCDKCRAAQKNINREKFVQSVWPGAHAFYQNVEVAK